MEIKEEKLTQKQLPKRRRKRKGKKKKKKIN